MKKWGMGVKWEKQWITNAHIASVFVVFAKTESGITAFIVERSMSGVSIGLEEKKWALKGHRQQLLFWKMSGCQLIKCSVRLGRTLHCTQYFKPSSFKTCLC